MEFDNELLQEFVLEAKAHIADIEAGLLFIEAGEADAATINNIFRAAHSIKGTASFFALHKIVEVAHGIETLFGELRENGLHVSTTMIDVLLTAMDVLKEMLDRPNDCAGFDITNQVAALRGLVTQPPNQTKSIESGLGTLSSWDLWNQLISGAESSVEAAPQSIAKQTIAPPVVQHQVREVMTEDSVRVNVNLLNDLLNIAGEMVLRRNQLLRVAQDYQQQVPQLDVIAKSIDELTTHLQKKVMKTRMQPVGNVFNKFPRIVRDMSRKVGKEIDLSLQGMNVELDRSLIEALVDPLTHLVRNALDHGIEAPEVREQKHKPIAGSLVLQAYHEGGKVIIDISDDGAGIDLGKVKSKAVSRGLFTEKDLEIWSEADILNLIMMPGFSTAEKVSDLSGRGVGMDVVKTNVEKMGGKIEILSEWGRGTTFRLQIPLTLAIISALLVEAAGQLFAIPQANVRELLLIDADETGEKSLEKVHQRPVLRLRGSLLPLVKLGDSMDTDRTAMQADDLAGDSPYEQKVRILVIKAGPTAYGLVVDSIYDTEEILVKPISRVLNHSGLYSGVTVLGDGSVAMILDTDRLRLHAGFSSIPPTLLPTGTQVAKPIGQEKQYLLLFACSGGEMLGLDMALVSRVVVVDLSQLQKVGSKYYLSLQGQVIRVIRPESFLPISRKKNPSSKAYIILPKLVKHKIGIIATQIHDAIFTAVPLDQDGVRGKGILGSTLIDDKVVILINMHELFALADPEDGRGANGTTMGASDKGVGPSVESERITILLVEDTPFFLKVVKSYLESDGYAVITAENGREAMEKLLKNHIDVVVSDIEMPLMTGIELVRAIRANETLRHLPVIALTSLTGEVHKEKGLRAGFDVYEYKLDRTSLLDSLRNVLQK